MSLDPPACVVKQLSQSNVTRSPPKKKEMTLGALNPGPLCWNTLVSEAGFTAFVCIISKQSRLDETDEMQTLD